MQKFVVDTLYELVDPKGLKAHLGWYDNLVRDIQHMGGTVKVHFVDKAGNARGLTFGNGKIDLQEVLGAETVVYFKPVEPVPMADVIKFPKKSQKLNEPLTIDGFPKRTEVSMAMVA